MPQFATGKPKKPTAILLDREEFHEKYLTNAQNRWYFCPLVRGLPTYTSDSGTLPLNLTPSPNRFMIDKAFDQVNFDHEGFFEDDFPVITSLEEKEILEEELP
ncbi:MAG: hypothetical protein AAGM67_19190, partial [Bacteroidota bacterium]